MKAQTWAELGGCRPPLLRRWLNSAAEYIDQRAKLRSLPECPRHPEGCLLALQLHHHWTQVGSLSSRTWSKQVTVPGEGGTGVLPCFVATREGDLGWPQQQPCWAWLRTVSGCFQKSPVWAAPTRPWFSRLRQPWGLQRAPQEGPRGGWLTTSQLTSQRKGRHFML